MDKIIVKVHKDVMTANEEISNIIEMYKSQGYVINRTSPISFQIVLDDGYEKINFWWEKGIIFFQ